MPRRGGLVRVCLGFVIVGLVLERGLVPGKAQTHKKSIHDTATRGGQVMEWVRYRKERLCRQAWPIGGSRYPCSNPCQNCWDSFSTALIGSAVYWRNYSMRVGD